MNETEVRRIIEEMRNEKARYKSHDLGFVDSVSASRVDEWADELERLLSVVRAEQGWQPIESAPKMRTILLFAVTDTAEDGTVRNWHMGTGSWHTGFEDERSRADGYTPWTWEGHQVRTYEVAPTHWMPLPPAPPVSATKEP